LNENYFWFVVCCCHFQQMGEKKVQQIKIQEKQNKINSIPLFFLFFLSFSTH